MSSPSPESASAAPRDFYTPDQLSELQPLPAAQTTSGSSGLYGVLGFPVRHSLSPGFQQAAFDALKLPARYVRVEIPPERFTEAVAELRKRPFAGWNVTLPHKGAMHDAVDELTDSARKLQGVNTVLNDGGRLIGFNTDGEGWIKAIREEFQADIRDLRIMILGAGGAGRALAIQAAIERCERLILVNRTYERVAELAEYLQPAFDRTTLIGPSQRLVALPWDEARIAEEINQVDLIVNATSVGLKAWDAPILPARVLQPHLLVYDTIYKPDPTRLLQEARAAGCRTANGLSMLLHQGAASFAIWTGQTPPLDVMRRTLLKALGRA
ncbi:MAG: shikimate dehydrogenase [Candidatus Methylacidiphilales bacterium]|nr:shikimate dehydrogenase [Candidatus Methylacidiphilales bacterium]